mgnify:CR=1 FL=1
MKRVLTAAVLVPVVVGAVFWAPSWAFVLLLAIVGAGAYREFEAISSAQGIDSLGEIAQAATMGANPMTYAGKSGKQYIGGVVGGSVVMYALP